MREEVLKILKENNKALSIYEINDILNLSTKEELQQLISVLKELTDEMKLYHTNKDKYMLLENSHLKTGKLIVNKKGYGFVDIDGEKDDIYVSSANLNGAIHSDIVVVEITSKKGMELEGRILKIIKRELETVVGTIVKENNKLKFKIDDEKININILLDE